MADEYIDDRERELLDFFRNNMEDPEARGTDIVDEEFIATAGQITFILANTLVKNVADTIKVNDVAIRKGYDFKVVYGEGNTTTKVILNTAATLGDEIEISYHYGQSLIEREYARTDSQLPRIVMMFLTGGEEFAGLGDLMEDSKGSYFPGAYRFEIRDKYASRARRLMSQMFNLSRKLRHKDLFRTLGSRAYDFDNFDYDREKAAYIWQFTLDIEWEILFE